MNGKLAITGNSGPKVRSDCEIYLELRSDGGIDIQCKSKVETLYGESIRRLCKEILAFYDIHNAFLKIEDTGALPFVISARVESAVKKLIDSNLDYLNDFMEFNKYSTEPDRFRFSRLYIPGNTPSMMINAGLHSADGIILDLEDSVAPEKKDEARILVRNALRQVNFYGAERIVRINQGERGLLDLEQIIPQHVNLILIPKCENADSVKIVEKKIEEILILNRLNYPVWLMPIIESAIGIEHAFEIASSSPKVVALAIGLEDLTSDMGVQRTKEGYETLYARTRLIMAAKAAGKQPIDSIYSDIDDMEGLLQHVLTSKSLGFEGMGCIHPRQVPIIRKGFAPGMEEIEKSKKIIDAYNEARQKGLGVVALGSKMIDPPVVARAERTIKLAIKLNLIPDDWVKQIADEFNH